MSVGRDLATAILGLALGASLGWIGPRPHASSTPAAVAAPRSRVVCTRQVNTPSEDDCPSVHTRLDWCDARLLAQTRPRPTTAPPAAIGADDEGAWNTQLTSVLVHCGIPGAASATECSEYPCVSALNAQGEDAATLTAKIESCMNDLPDKSSLGLGPNGTVAAIPLPIDCGDGNYQTLLMVGELDEDALQALDPQGSYGLLGETLLTLGSRRAEALAKVYRCPP